MDITFTSHIAMRRCEAPLPFFLFLCQCVNFCMGLNFEQDTYETFLNQEIKIRVISNSVYGVTEIQIFLLLPDAPKLNPLALRDVSAKAGSHKYPLAHFINFAMKINGLEYNKALVEKQSPAVASREEQPGEASTKLAFHTLQNKP